MKLVVFLDQILNIDELYVLMNNSYKNYCNQKANMEFVSEGKIINDTFSIGSILIDLKNLILDSEEAKHIFKKKALERLINSRDFIDENIKNFIQNAILKLNHGESFPELDTESKKETIKKDEVINSLVHGFFLLTKTMFFLDKIYKQKHNIESVEIIWSNKFIDIVKKFEKGKEKVYLEKYGCKKIFESEDLIESSSNTWDNYCSFFVISNLYLLMEQLTNTYMLDEDRNIKLTKIFNLIQNEYLKGGEIYIENIETIRQTKVDIRSRSNLLYNENINREEICFIVNDLSKNIEDEFIRNGNCGIIDMNSSIKYDKDYYLIKDIINIDSEEGQKYELDFTEALDPKLSEVLNVLFDSNTTENYAYLICDDKFICTKIIEELKQKLKFTEHDLSDGIRIEYLNDDLNIFINFNKLENKNQRELWNKVVDKKTLVKKTVFIDTKVPKNGLINLNSFKVWNYDSSVVKKRLSLIFHQLIPPRSKTPVSNNTVKRIRENYYRDLIQVTEEINIKSISDSLNHALLQGNKFNYSSIEDWFIFRKHLKLIDNPKSKTSNSSEIEKITIEIIYDVTKDKYAQISLGKNYIKGEVKKSLFIIMIVLKYWQLFNKGIDHTHLFIIANEYLKRKDSEQKIIERINNEIEPKLDYAAIHSAIMGEGVKNIDSRLKDFVKDHFKMSSTKVTFTPNLKQNNKNIQYLINADKFNIDVKLLSDNYISILQKKYSK
ncbi:MAG: hypothetical protein KF816_17290 [Melioribacteraceae bacterium]|nr:hypothetical protein [Melioribacteraceae bacterium]